MRLSFGLLRFLLPALLGALIVGACSNNKAPNQQVGKDVYGPGVTSTPSSFAPISSATPAPSVTVTPVSSAVGAVVGTAAAGSGPAGTTPFQVTDTATDNAFSNKEIRVAVNQTVQFTLQNKGAAIHNWHLLGVQAANGKDVQTGLLPGGQSETITFIVSKPGTYKFQCDVHPTEMTGQLIVS